MIGSLHGFPQRRGWNLTDFLSRSFPAWCTGSEQRWGDTQIFSREHASQWVLLWRIVTDRVRMLSIIVDFPQDLSEDRKSRWSLSDHVAGVYLTSVGGSSDLQYSGLLDGHLHISTLTVHLLFRVDKRVQVCQHGWWTQNIRNVKGAPPHTSPPRWPPSWLRVRFETAPPWRNSHALQVSTYRSQCTTWKHTSGHLQYKCSAFVIHFIHCSGFKAQIDRPKFFFFRISLKRQDKFYQANRFQPAYCYLVYHLALYRWQLENKCLLFFPLLVVCPVSETCAALFCSCNWRHTKQVCSATTWAFQFLNQIWHK